MAIWSDLIEPRDLTVFARRTQAAAEAAEGSLSRWFPTVTVDGDTAKYTVAADGGLVPTAEFRAWDTESPIANGVGGRRVTLELPPISLKARIGELDHIRDRHDTNNSLRIAARATARLVEAVTERMRVLQADILNTGRLTINENGFQVDNDLGRNVNMSVTASPRWDAASSDPIADLITWAEHYNAVNGVMPAVLLTSRRTVSVFQRNAGVLAAIGGNATRTVATLDELNALLGSYGLPGFTVFDRNADVGGTVRRYLPVGKVFLLPAAGSNELGQTVFGRTAEADAPEYGIAGGDGAGLVAALHQNFDPYSKWAHVVGIGLPIMTNPNASMVATVLT